MYDKIKLFRITVLLSAVLLLTLAALPASAETIQALNSTQVTKIRMNGLSADAFLIDGDVEVGGALTVSKDQIANTVALDFSYAFPHSTNPDLRIFIQGAGEIPITAFTISKTSARLAVTTPASYSVVRCVINTITGDFTCDPGDPVTFDLTWVKADFGSVVQKTKRTETFGPVTTKFDGEFTSLTAAVSGTWSDIPGAVMSGNLLDTKSKTFMREVTMQMNP